MSKSDYLRYLLSLIVKSKRDKNSTRDVLGSGILESNATQELLARTNMTRDQYWRYLTRLLTDTQDLPSRMNSDMDFHTYFYKVAVPVLFGLITLIGVLGNLLVIFVILSKTQMRTNVNLLLLNLAFCDLLFLLVCVPFVTYHYAGDSWVIGDALCKTFQYSLYLTVYVTMYTLVAISVMRYVMIVYSQKSVRLCTKRNTCLLIAVIWIVMLVVNVPTVFVYRVKDFASQTPSLTISSSSQPYKYCGIASKQIGQKMFIGFFVLTYALPLGLICTFYLLLLRFLNLHRPASLRSTTTSRGRERRGYASRILLAVVLVCGSCWLPLHCHLLVTYFSSQPKSRYYEVFRVLCHCLAYSNSCMNPIIYNFVSKDFRKGFRSVLLSCLCCSSVMHRLLQRRRDSSMETGATGVTLSGNHRKESTLLMCMQPAGKVQDTAWYRGGGVETGVDGDKGGEGAPKELEGIIPRTTELGKQVCQEG